MATTTLDRYVGSNGEVLLPLSDSAYSNLISSKGTYFIAQTTTTAGIEAGNPMGLLLTLTYPATP